MLKRRPALLLALGVALAAWAVIEFSPSSEPTYQGRQLRHWVGFFSHPATPDEVAQEQSATDALRHMGTNAFPLLLQWVSCDESLARNRWWSRLPVSLRKFRAVQRLVFYSPGDRRAYAAGRALVSLGPDAGPVLPNLADLLVTTTNFMVRTRCMWILREIGQPSVPALTAAAADPRSHTNYSLYEILHTLELIGTNASGAAPALRGLLQEAEPSTQWAYSNTLRQITAEPLNGPSPGGSN